MCSIEPSPSFRTFDREANEFQIQDRPSGGPLRFDAKQRMITRAEGFAIREAYQGIPWWRLFVPGVLRQFFDGMRTYEGRLAAASANPELDDERHRAEICLNLYARTIQQFTQRRLYTVAAVASTFAAVASVAALGIAIRSLISSTH